MDDEHDTERPLSPRHEPDYAGFLIRTCALAVDALAVGILLLLESLIVLGLWALGLVPLTSKEMGEGLGLLLAIMF